MTPVTAEDGSTPLSPEEQNDLIPDLTTKDELNEWERQNILEAVAWALDQRNLNRQDPFSEAYVRQLHLRMFDQTWKWAGKYRTTEKNIGIPHYRIRESLPALLGDARYWVEHQTFEPDELAVRFHHKFVCIHPFANGNGRHARLMADVVVRRLGKRPFTWGSADIVRAGDFRRSYIQALRAADKNDIRPLLAFARS
ncbi:MAG: mobile mystery protein B [Terracidiphilus sp.]